MAVLRHAVRQLRVRPDRVSVIRRGRDPQRLGRPSAERRRAARRELGLHGDSPVLVNMGRHEYQKGQRYLLEAVTELLPKYPGITALIAGREGSATAELRTLAGQLCVEENVRFLGHRQDVPEILAAGDVFVFPSLFEGLPGAVLEAMALGLPIVASRIEPLLEVVEEGSNALLFTPRRSSELARCVDRLLSAQDVAGRFGRRSREIFDSRFTIEQSTDQMADLYAELVRGWSVPN